jgi:hypothetical protein
MTNKKSLTFQFASIVMGLAISGNAAPKSPAAKAAPVAHSQTKVLDISLPAHLTLIPRDSEQKIKSTEDVQFFTQSPAKTNFKPIGVVYNITKNLSIDMQVEQGYKKDGSMNIIPAFNSALNLKF